MADPITNDDLYGTSKDQPQTEPAKPTQPLTYEETPEVALPHPPTPPPPPPKKSGSFLGTLVTFILFVGLFAAGIWLSSVVRQFVPAETEDGNITTRQPTPSAGARVTPLVTGAPTVNEQWKTYDVISGTTKLPFAGITFKLPSNVLSPICDGTGCASQGTYLPGGSRFTVAPRGTGATLADFRGSIISDANGTSFTTKKVTVAGRPATEFTGLFTGRTLSGYAFSRMRGVMIEVSATTSLEVNHFTPNGVTADFVADDEVFNQILTTISIPGTAPSSPTPTSSVPLSTSTPTPATGSGY